MSVTLDQEIIKRIALEVKPEAMVAAEAELATVNRELADVCQRIGADNDIATGLLQTPLKPISADDRRAAQIRLGHLNSTRLTLDRAAKAAQEKLSAHSAANAAAVRGAMIPLRKAAATRVLSIIADLEIAISNLNATGSCLRESGTPATLMPLPLLEGMRKIAHSITTAPSPEQERR